MSDDDAPLEPNPANPLCPICGAADWVSDPRWGYALPTIDAATNRLVDKDGVVVQMPLTWFICRVCRYVRLHSAAGDLRFPSD